MANVHFVSTPVSKLSVSSSIAQHRPQPQLSLSPEAPSVQGGLQLPHEQTQRRASTGGGRIFTPGDRVAVLRDGKTTFGTLVSQREDDDTFVVDRVNGGKLVGVLASELRRATKADLRRDSQTTFGSFSFRDQPGQGLERIGEKAYALRFGESRNAVQEKPIANAYSLRTLRYTGMYDEAEEKTADAGVSAGALVSTGNTSVASVPVHGPQSPRARALNPAIRRRSLTGAIARQKQEMMQAKQSTGVEPTLPLAADAKSSTATDGQSGNDNSVDMTTASGGTALSEREAAEGVVLRLLGAPVTEGLQVDQLLLQAQKRSQSGDPAARAWAQQCARQPQLMGAAVATLCELLRAAREQLSAARARVVQHVLTHAREREQYRVKHARQRETLESHLAYAEQLLQAARVRDDAVGDQRSTREQDGGHVFSDLGHTSSSSSCLDTIDAVGVNASAGTDTDVGGATLEIDRLHQLIDAATAEGDDTKDNDGDHRDSAGADRESVGSGVASSLAQVHSVSGAHDVAANKDIDEDELREFASPRARELLARRSAETAIARRECVELKRQLMADQEQLRQLRAHVDGAAQMSSNTNSDSRSALNNGNSASNLSGWERVTSGTAAQSPSRVSQSQPAQTQASAQSSATFLGRSPPQFETSSGRPLNEAGRRLQQLRRQQEARLQYTSRQPPRESHADTVLVTGDNSDDDHEESASAIARVSTTPGVGVSNAHCRKNMSLRRAARSATPSSPPLAPTVPTHAPPLHDLHYSEPQSPHQQLRKRHAAQGSSLDNDNDVTACDNKDGNHANEVPDFDPYTGAPLNAAARAIWSAREKEKRKLQRQESRTLGHIAFERQRQEQQQQQQKKEDGGLGGQTKRACMHHEAENYLHAFDALDHYLSNMHGSAEFRAAFDRIDEDHSGMISLSEFQIFVAHDLGLSLTRKEIEVIFHTLDEDKSNSLQASELISGCKAARRTLLGLHEHEELPHPKPLPPRAPVMPRSPELDEESTETETGSEFGNST